ncbi:MAG: acyl-CoA thioesterase [Cytophagales bacterium]
MVDPVKKEASLTRHFKTVFPFRMNHHHTLFGGFAMQWMDEVAFICATRYSKKRLVTLGSEKIVFLKPVWESDFAEVLAFVEKVGNKSISVKVEIWSEKMYEEKREKCVEGFVSFVAVDENGNSVSIE